MSIGILLRGKGTHSGVALALNFTTSWLSLALHVRVHRCWLTPPPPSFLLLSFAGSSPAISSNPLPQRQERNLGNILRCSFGPIVGMEQGSAGWPR